MNSEQKSKALEDFGSKCIEDLMQGEWEPDCEWRDEMLEVAEKMRLITRRPVTPDDDVTDEFDFIWERL